MTGLFALVLLAETRRPARTAPYQVQAAIAAVHCDAPTADGTDWAQVVALYDLLMRLAPSPVVALKRAVALAEVDGPEAALAVVDALDLPGYPYLHATRAELLTRLGRAEEARDALTRALRLTTNEPERRLLVARLDALPPPGSPRGPA